MLIFDQYAGYTALGIALVVLVFLSCYRLALPKPIPGIPYEKAAANSIFGNMMQVLAFQKTHGRTMLWFAKYSEENAWPLSQVWLRPFSKPMLILTDFAETENILLRKSRHYGRGQSFTDTLDKVVPEFHVTLEKEDPRYNANKGLLRDTMTPSFLQSVSAPQIYQASNNLVDLWKFKLTTARGRPFDALEDIFNAASDMITAAAFALNDDMSTTFQQLNYLKSLNGDFSLESNPEHGGVAFPHLPPLPHIAALDRLSKHIGELGQSIFPRLTHWSMMLTEKELRSSYGTAKRFEASEIEKSIARLESDEPPASVLDHMVYREKQAANNENRRPDFHRRGIYDELTGYYQAGHETTATTVTWAVKYLAQNANSQEKLREALHQRHAAAFQAGRQPTVEEIVHANIPYLNAVIEETLRMRPPFPALIRCALVDTEVMGCMIPKGTSIMMPSIGPGLHTPALPRPDYLGTSSAEKRRDDWSSKDVHMFKPERWLKRDEEGKAMVFDASAGPMQSFGFGPRQCFGKRLAYIQLKVFLTLLMWNFKLKELQGKIASDDAHESTTLAPKYCFVKLEEA
ncbi:cytochrome p450 monooxygenase [Colletotrichum truncatum]|uniref:Cytochrome p450 monooxygenase n=1 Tax=Colletotrichum truncatum TaxID=5467 RepID=A0ACC3ZLJ8_COLTU|nr:cytochrome p450 monooxygenase [Colletotrichum truncatum]KAF6786923.1 cytochrome p450 monooxygenase [Colletotrichum truncatum]